MTNRARRPTRSPRASATLGSFLAAATALASTACASHSTDTTGTSDATLLVEDGADANDVAAQTSSLTAAFTLAQTAAPLRDLDAVIADADDARSYFAPAGCLAIASDAVAHSVTYTLDACSGPWGLARVTGVITATYALSTATDGASVLAIDVTSDVLRLNRATASYHATATVIANGVARSMAWSGTLSGTTARGRPLNRTATWKLGWTLGESCVRLDGSASGNVTGRGLSTTVTNYMRCKGECPQAGGDVAIVENANGYAIDVQFTGTDVAVVRGGGATYDVTLACTP